MYPAYTWTESYPHHENPMHYAPSDNPRIKEIPSRMKMDPSTLNPAYQPWPHGGNYCYPVPPECHSYCNHSYFGGPYGFRPPYPHYTPPQPFHAHGFYPPFPGAYPAYPVPPPHYSVELPKYDYDKNIHAPHHCCACTHREDDRKSRIEREEPEVDKKTGDSLVPFQLKNYPYPIMWVPPGYMKNNASEAKEREKHSHDPVSLKPLEPSKQAENGEATGDQQGGDGDCLPSPIFWLPSKNNEVGKDAKENNLGLLTHNGAPFSRSDDKKEQPRKSGEDSGSEAESETSSKHAVQKVIPVKQLGTEEETKSPKTIEAKEKSRSVEKSDDAMEGKPSSRTSKLPPVCLRIDPLPRKKNGSRSPSPPTDKGRSKGLPVDNAKSSQQQMPTSEGLKKSEEEQSKGNIKTIEVINDASKVARDSLGDPCENVSRDIEIKDCGEMNEGEKGIVQGQSGKGEPCKAEKQQPSEHEAALLIQSVYRGFDVRKSQPLKKLRQISEVRKQVVELRTRIQDLESSSSCIHIDDKHKLIIGETIMSLLLKLDTIQGLHPIVRDARKSIAKELVGLQEKLDSVTFVKSETQSEETISSTKHVMNLEDDAILEKSDHMQTLTDSNVKSVESGMGISENHEVEATESEDNGGAEARDNNIVSYVELRNQQSTGELNNNQLQVLVDTEQPVVDAIQEKSGQDQAQSDSNNEIVGLDTGRCENCEVEAKEAQDNGVVEARDNKPKPQVELKNQQSTGELNNNQHPMLAESGQPVVNAAQEKSDQAQAQSRSEVETVESGTGVCEHHEVEAAESQDDGGAEARDINLEPQVELKARQTTEDDGGAEAHDINLKTQVELITQQTTEKLKNSQLQTLEMEQSVDDPIQESDQTQAQFDNDVENVESDTGMCEDHEVEATESEDAGVVRTHDINLNMKNQGSTGEPKNDQLDQLQMPVDTMQYTEVPPIPAAESVATAEVRAELSKEDAVNEIHGDRDVLTEQEDSFDKEYQETPKVDNVESPAEVQMEDLGGAVPSWPPGSHGDRKLTEENEKLREAVEELMKAGNKQMGVIRELMGRVKDLEKQLSRKKKMKVKKGRSRGCVHRDEARELRSVMCL